MNNKNVIIANCMQYVSDSIKIILEAQGASVYELREAQNIKADILICGVGKMPFACFNKIEEADIEKAVRKNIIYNIKFIRNFIQNMIDKRNGKIICLIPQYSSHAVWGTSCISMISGAMKAFIMGLAMDYCKYNIRANCIEYGLGIDENCLMYDDKSKLNDLQPIKRACVPEDIARATLFLSTDMSAFISGETIPVNGGAFCIGHNQVWNNWLNKI